MTTEESAMSGNDPLAEADKMITAAWGQPISALTTIAMRRPVEDPLLRSVMHVRQTLASACTAVHTHQKRLHTLTGSDVITSRYDLDRITASAAALRVAGAEAETALRAIDHLTYSHELAGQTHRTHAERGRAAATTPARRQEADGPAVPPPVPTPPARAPHR